MGLCISPSLLCGRAVPMFGCTADMPEVDQLLSSVEMQWAWSMRKQLMGRHGARSIPGMAASAMLKVHALSCWGYQYKRALRMSRKCAPSITAEWAVQLLLLPVEAVELLHAFVCLQVGAAFSDPWAINNTVQVCVWVGRRAGGWVGGWVNSLYAV